MRTARQLLRCLAFVLAVLYCTVLGGSAFVPSSYAASALPVAAPKAGPVVLVGTGGFTWEQVSPQTTPNLWRLAQEGAIAALSVKSVNLDTCPIDGWLSLSAGERAAAAGADGSAYRAAGADCPALPDPADGRIPGWPEYLATANSLRFDARPGTLGEELASADVPTVALGPGAGIALARRSGEVTAYRPVDWATVPPNALAAELTTAGVAVVDIGTAVARSASLGPAELDRRIGLVQAALPAGATLIVAGLADERTGPRLRPLVVTGPGIAPGLLRSPSTRHTGLAQSPDLTVTVLELAGARVPAALGGAALQPRADDRPVAERHADVLDLDLAADRIQRLVGPFFYLFAITALAGLAFATWLARSPRATPRVRRRALAGLRIGGLWAMAVPAATFLANLLPWWRTMPSFPALVGAVGLASLLLTGIAVLGPWGRGVVGPVAAIAALTLGVLAADVLTGSRLQLSSLLGLQPLVGGRFYGFGNVAFAIVATASLLLAVGVAQRGIGRRWVLAAVALLGVFTLVVDGHPAAGADGGGPLAYAPAVVVFVLAARGIRLTWGRAVALVAGTAALFLTISWLDSLRPAQSRSHLGRFFVALREGQAGDIVIRKAQQNLDLLGATVLAPLVPVALIAAIVLLLRRGSVLNRGLAPAFAAVPALRPGLLAWLVLVTIGLLTNDSGLAIPAVGALVLLPAQIAIQAGVLRHTASPAPANAAPFPKNGG